MARITIADLQTPTPQRSAAGELDLEAVLAATLDPNMPLDRLLGLQAGDAVRIADGKGVVVRASGAVEPIQLGAPRGK